MEHQGSNGKPTPDLDSFVGYLIKRLYFASTGAVNAALEREGLTSTQFGALSVVARRPGLSAAELAAEVGISAQAASTLVERLGARGLLERSPSPVDGRSFELTVPPAGRRSLARAARIVEAAELSLLAGLSPDEQATLRDLCRRALASLKHL